MKCRLRRQIRQFATKNFGLTVDLPEHGLRPGDIGTVVMVHQGGAGYEVEFMTLGGETVAIVSLFAHQVRPITSKEIAHARTLEAA